MKQDRCIVCSNIFKKRHAKHKTCYVCSSQLSESNKKELLGFSKDDKFRTCSRCGDSFLDTPSNWKRIAKIKNTGTCKVCEAEYQKENYKKNIDSYRERNRLARIKNRGEK